MKFQHWLSFGAFGLIVVLSVYYIAALGVPIRQSEDRVNVTMQVADINGLVVDSRVLLRGVAVGKVTQIEGSLAGANVHFYLDSKHPIPIDSEVRLENLSALGESYIGLLPRVDGGPAMVNGQRIATEDIVAPASISELATGVVRVLDQLDPNALNRLVAQADRALPDQDAVLPNLTRASALLRNAVAGMNGQGAQVLENFQTLLSNAGWVGPKIAEITPSLLALGVPMNKMFVNALHVVIDTGSPEGVKNVGRLFARIQEFLDTRAPDLQVFAEAFTPNVQAIAAAAMNFDTGRILSNMLDAIPADGTITLRVKTPAP